MCCNQNEVEFETTKKNTEFIVSEKNKHGLVPLNVSDLDMDSVAQSGDASNLRIVFN